MQLTLLYKNLVAGVDLVGCGSDTSVVHTVLCVRCASLAVRRIHSGHADGLYAVVLAARCIWWVVRNSPCRPLYPCGATGCVETSSGWAPVTQTLRHDMGNDVTCLSLWLQWHAIEGGCWPFQHLADHLVGQIIDPRWEVRHGAAVALREVLRYQAACAAVEAPLADLSSGWAEAGGEGEPDGSSPLIHCSSIEPHQWWYCPLCSQALPVISLVWHRASLLHAVAELLLACPL